MREDLTFAIKKLWYGYPDDCVPKSALHQILDAKDHGVNMDKHGHAKVIKELMDVYESLNRACGGAQYAKDEKLFHLLFQKQTEIMEIVHSLIKD